MPPSTRSRPSAPPSRIYESTTPLAQAKLPPIRQRVYGRHSLGAPLTKKRQGTLTQIGFVNPEKIEDEIAEYEKEEMERSKRRKTERGPPLRKELRAKPVIGQRDTAISETRLGRMMNKEEVEEERAKPVPAQLKHEASVQRLDDTPEPEVGEGRPKKKRKSRKGITIGVKTVIIKIESPEVQRTQYHAQDLDQREEEETQEGGDINMVMDSFQAAPSFEEERNYESYVKMDAEQVAEAQRRRNRVIPDSDADSEDESIVYDSNDEARNEDVPATHAEQLPEPVDDAVPRGGSDVDLDEIKDSVEEKPNSERDLDEISDITEEDKPHLDLDLTREIPDSQAESEDDEDIHLEVPEFAPAPQSALKQEDTLILNSFSVPSSGSPAIQPRLKTKLGPGSMPHSFSIPASPTAESAEQQPAIIKDSFYHKPPTLQQDSSFERLAPPAPSPMPEEEVDFVPSSSAVSVPDALPIPDGQEAVPAMPPPPVTPRKPRRTEIPNTGSTCSELSTQSTIRSMTPNSLRSKRYNQSPTKGYNRSPLKRLAEKNILKQDLSLPRLDLTPDRENASSVQLRESQISTQGTPTQKIRVSQVSFIKPEQEVEPNIYDEDETTIIPASPTLMKVEKNGTQNTTDTNSPSRQIHSELSAALSSEQNQPPSSGRTIKFMKTEIKASQAESDDDQIYDDGEYHHSIEAPQGEPDDEIYDGGEYHHSMEEELHDGGESMEIVVEGDRVRMPPSPKPITPRVVRFQSVARDIQPQLQFYSSPVVPGSDLAMGGEGTQTSSMYRPSVVFAETQMRSQWLGSDGLGPGSIVGDGAPTQGTLGGESQWLGDLLPESLMGLAGEELSVPPIMADDDSVWDEFRSSRASLADEIED